MRAVSGKFNTSDFVAWPGQGRSHQMRPLETKSDDMTDFAMTPPFAAPRRPARFVRPGRPGGLWGAVHYAGVLAVWLVLFVVDRPLALKVMAERRADSPIPRHWGW